MLRLTIATVTILATHQVAYGACPAPEPQQIVPNGSTDVGTSCPIEVWALTEQLVDPAGLSITWEGGEAAFLVESISETASWGYDHYDCDAESCELELSGNYSWTFEGTRLRPTMPLPAQTEIVVLNADGIPVASFRTDNGEGDDCPGGFFLETAQDCIDQSCENVAECSDESNSNGNSPSTGCSVARGGRQPLPLGLLALALLATFRSRRRRV